MSASLPLVLGGHSFIQQLGADAMAPADEQIAIVKACLDNGITWFDTTYQPERIALGRALAQLGRRDEATIIAWNFFVDFAPGGEVGGPAHYQPHHIDLMCEQLRTERIDYLVVHSMGDPKEDRRQEELAQLWQQQGRVKRLGTWWPPADADMAFGTQSPYAFMVRPYNVTTADAPAAFAACKRLGWETLACSPFVRGWELDKMVQREQQSEGGATEAIRSDLADLMLRYSLFSPNVDRLIVASRKAEWVANNARSVRRGPLSAEERQRLLALAAQG
jgi:aryl-alcohol dehydrogenase-like predicted oxidoreductase